MRLTLVIFSLSSGGAERVMSTMANYWVQKNWHVTLLTFEDGRGAPFYKLHPRVTHVPLGIAALSANRLRGIATNVRRIRTLRQAIRSSGPDAVIAFIDKVNVLTLLAAVGLKVRVVVSERVDPRAYPIGRLWNCLRNIAYRRAHRVVVQTESAKIFFPSPVQRRTKVIPNPAINSGESTSRSDRGPHKQIIAMGRLTFQKGFDLLLEAFARIAAGHPDWTLVIWGHGEGREELEKLRDHLNLNQRVIFQGRTNRPFEELNKADLFVLSSRFEGFPNALCEAMASGLPVISFDCPSGPREIVRDNVDGVLVPPGDAVALASAMDRLMSDDATRKRLAARAVEVTDRFALGKIMAMWEEVLIPDART